MPKTRLSVNRRALKLVRKLCEDAEEYGVLVKKTKTGATFIDAGIKAKGGFQAGKIITEICLGGYGEVAINPVHYDDVALPSVFVHTIYPAVSTLGSQFADWQIKEGDYAAIGSGPARALARKNAELYEKIGYEDESDETVMVLETNAEPPKPVVRKVARDCRIRTDKLWFILVPTTCVAGSTQVSGRIVETGLHKLLKVGLDPKSVMNAFGSAPIAPVHPKLIVAMGRTNDAILYAGFAHYDVAGYSDEKLKEFVQKTPSSASKSYGLPFHQIFKSAGYDFYKIDPNLFAPALVSVCNLESGGVFRAGKINFEVFRRSIGLDKT